MKNKFTLKNKRGQAMVETIFVLPILILLIFGIIEFGRIYFTYMVLSNAAREGARYSAVDTTFDVEGHIENITATIGDVTVTRSDTSDDVIILVSHDLELITPIVGPMISSDGHFDLKARAEMRKE